MSGWDSWGPPKEEDDEPRAELPPEPVEPDAGDYGWGNYPDWPARDTSDYGFGATREAESATAQDRSRSHDPLAKLFPGLSRGTRVFLDWVLTIVGAVLIVLALKAWVVNPYRIPSSSMEPYLKCARPALDCTGNSSDRVLACRICLTFSDPSRGDVIVFKTPTRAAHACAVNEGETFVKRLIGLPGEEVKEDDNGHIWIRGPGSKTYRELKESYISAQTYLKDAQQHPDYHNHVWKVPEGRYFMMGDNRSESCDSRQWGTVPRSDLIGTVFFVYWPPDRISFK